jgi:hypothetical protein
MGKRQRKRSRTGQVSVQLRERSMTIHRAPAEFEATARLRQLVERRMRIETEIDAEVDHLEGRGFSWPTIARALGVTRQAARQRYQRRHVVKRLSAAPEVPGAASVSGPDDNLASLIALPGRRVC